MKNKIFIQAFLVFLIILIFFGVYLNYFKKVNKIDNLKVEKENFNKENSLINITYESIDATGKKYIINADSGKFDEQKPDLIFMTDVNAKIILSVSSSN